MASLNFLIRPLRYWVDDIAYRLMADKSAMENLKGKYSGQPMLVVGNGPSLNQTPLEDFSSVPAIGMNKIDLLYARSSWRPSFVACANDAVVLQHKNVFAESEIPIWLAWKSRWFMPRTTRNVHYYPNRTSDDFSTDATRGISVGDTVTFVALQMAYWMGASPVIIFGVDHSFKNVGAAKEYKRWEGADVNHFDPNYFQHGSLFGNPDLDASEIQYANARRAFEADGRRVVDATVGGKLEIFEKVSVDEAKKLAKVD